MINHTSNIAAAASYVVVIDINDSHANNNNDNDDDNNDNDNNDDDNDDHRGLFNRYPEHLQFGMEFYHRISCNPLATNLDA